jgi:hypothetical protein
MLAFVALTAGPVAAGSDNRPMLVQGRLLDANGSPARGVVRVYLLAPGPTGKLPYVRTLQTTANGRFLLRSTVTPDMASAAGRNGGWVNLIAVGYANGRSFSTAFTRRFDRVRWASPRDAAVSIDIRIPAAPGTRLGAAQLRSLNLAQDPSPASDSSSATSCIYVHESYANNLTQVGELHPYYSDATGLLTYGTSADSDVGVGVTINNGSTWSQSGTIHIGSAASDSVPGALENVGRGVGMYFQYDKYHLTCEPFDEHHIQVNAFAGGDAYIGNLSGNDGKCHSAYPSYTVSKVPGSTFVTSTERAFKWSAGVNAFGVVNLSTQSGFSTYVDIKYTYGHSLSIYYICGNDNVPTLSHRVFAGG